MIIIGVIAAICLYILLYWGYMAAESQLSGAVSFLTVINQALFLPELMIFKLMRALILIIICYAVADAILSPARRGLKRRKQGRLDAERDQRAFRGIKKNAPPSDEDASDATYSASSNSPPKPASKSSLAQPRPRS